MGIDPTIEFIVPTYNQDALLRRAVASCLAVRGCSGVIVVDDGSQEPVDPDGFDDDRVRVVHQANAGPAAARNNGLGLAKDRFICFCDSDDRVLPEIILTLELMVRTGASVGCPNRIRVYADGRERRLILPDAYRDALLPRPGAIFGVDEPIFGACGMIVDREQIGDLRFDESLENGEDSDFMRRAGAFGGICACDAPGTLITRGRRDNQTGDARIDVIVSCFLDLMGRWYEDDDSSVWRHRLRAMAIKAAKHAKDDTTYPRVVAELTHRRWGVPLKARWARVKRSVLR
ncbi:MAG: glycosyltransferase family 2 protein [Planctomycetota bacterium]